MLDQTPLVQGVELDVGASREGSLSIHRLDQLFPLGSGNKAYKLVGHCHAAQRAGRTHLISFGGAWSNHLHALAYFAHRAQLSCTAIVRGLYVDLDNPMLADARAQGMRVIKVSKQEYSRRRDRHYLKQLMRQYPGAWVIPEGGDDALGRWGVRKLANSLRQSIPEGDTLVVAAGTGATVRSLAQQLGARNRLVAALVVNDAKLAKRLEQLGSVHCPRFQVVDASGSGYGRISDAQLRHLQRLVVRSGILLDPLYNGKAYAVATELASKGERVHLLHTGGLQGWRGFLSCDLLAFYPELARTIIETNPKLHY
ncbi:MAG: 1-aminocyclopropane-1-carboxylate deaminase/D-cysteine desulfhydrase [Granulosicoccaceae bacterium]